MSWNSLKPNREIFWKINFWSSKNLKNHILGMVYFKKTYPKRTLNLKSIKFGGIMYLSVLNSFLERKKYFYWLLTSILAKIDFWAKWDIVEIPKYFFVRNNFFYLIWIWGLRKSILKIDRANICEDHFLIKNANTWKNFF